GGGHHRHCGCAGWEVLLSLALLALRRRSSGIVDGWRRTLAGGSQTTAGGPVGARPSAKRPTPSFVRGSPASSGLSAPRARDPESPEVRSASPRPAACTASRTCCRSEESRARPSEARARPAPEIPPC